MATELNIKDGPTKPDLELSVSSPERHLHLSFATDGVPIVVHLDKMREIGDGTEFELKGHVVSESHKSKAFTALYDVETRTGTMERTASGPSLEAFIATERSQSPSFDGRSVFGWEKGLARKPRTG